MKNEKDKALTSRKSKKLGNTEDDKIIKLSPSEIVFLFLLPILISLILMASKTAYSSTKRHYKSNSYNLHSQNNRKTINYFKITNEEFLMTKSNELQQFGEIVNNQRIVQLVNNIGEIILRPSEPLSDCTKVGFTTEEINNKNKPICQTSKKLKKLNKIFFRLF